MLTLTKENLVTAIRDHLAVSTQESKEILEVILEELKMELESGAEVKISNFGKWRVQNKRQRLGRNPNTGAPMEITARKVVSFHPAEKLRTVLNDT